MENISTTYTSEIYTEIKLPDPPAINFKPVPTATHRVLRDIYDDTPRNEYGGAIGRDC